MTAGHAVSIELTEELYEGVRQVAEWSGQPIEKVLIEGMLWWYNKIRADDVDALMKRFRTFSNVELRAVVYQRLPLQDVERMDFLTEKGKAGLLTPEEKNELDDLVDLIQYQMLLRSEALLLLKERGQDADGYFYDKKL